MSLFLKKGSSEKEPHSTSFRSASIGSEHSDIHNAFALRKSFLEASEPANEAPFAPPLFLKKRCFEPARAYERATRTPCASIWSSERRTLHVRQCFSPTGLATLRLNRSANPACSTIQNLTHNLYKYKLVNINK